MKMPVSVTRRFLNAMGGEDSLKTAQSAYLKVRLLWRLTAYEWDIAFPDKPAVRLLLDTHNAILAITPKEMQDSAEAHRELMGFNALDLMALTDSLSIMVKTMFVKKFGGEAFRNLLEDDKKDGTNGGNN